MHFIYQAIKECSIFLFLASPLSFMGLVHAVEGERPFIYDPDGHMLQMNFSSYWVWSEHQRKKDPQLVMAVIGRPTAPLDPDLRKGMCEYWQHAGKEPINYGDPKGELIYRERMAAALNRQYNGTINFSADDVTFTVGGTSGLHAIFHTLRLTHPDKKIVTTNPYYPTYRGYRGEKTENDLFYIDISQNGYRLTEEVLRNGLRGVDIESIGGFLFCDPNNPAGSVVGRGEWEKIGRFFREYPEVPIVIDEAYGEMVFDGVHESFIEAAPYLTDRIILLRSATKGLSAAGERCAIVATTNKAYMSKLVNYSISNYLHSPKSSQHAYTYAMECLTPQKREKLAEFYKFQIDKVANLLKVYGFSIKDETYKVEGTFYILADMSDLFGVSLEPAVQNLYIETRKVISTDIDIGFHLLMKYGIAFAPLSFFGVSDKNGLMRITCSLSPQEMIQLENKLRQIREDIEKTV